MPSFVLLFGKTQSFYMKTKSYFLLYTFYKYYFSLFVQKINWEKISYFCEKEIIFFSVTQEIPNFSVIWLGGSYLRSALKKIDFTAS